MERMSKAVSHLKWSRELLELRAVLHCPLRHHRQTHQELTLPGRNSVVEWVGHGPALKGILEF